MEERSGKARHKMYLREYIIDALYAHEIKADKHCLDAFVDANNKSLKQMFSGFSYKGTKYMHSGLAAQRTVPRLQEEFHSSMNKYLLEHHEVFKYELPMVTGFITAAINVSQCGYDYYRIFPDAMHSIIGMGQTEPTSKNYLSDSTVLDFCSKHETSIELLKKRLLLNLITN